MHSSRCRWVLRLQQSSCAGRNGERHPLPTDCETFAPLAVSANWCYLAQSMTEWAETMGRVSNRIRVLACVAIGCWSLLLAQRYWSVWPIDLTAPYFAARFAALLQARYPGITPAVLSLSSPEIENGLETLRLDIGLGYTDRPQNFDYTFSRFADLCATAAEVLGLIELHLLSGAPATWHCLAPEQKAGADYDGAGAPTLSHRRPRAGDGT